MSYKKKQIPNHEIILKGIKLIIRKSVFSPTNSTRFVLDNMPNLEQKEILDVGCGSGILGIYCALNGAKKIVAVDTNKNALENTKENIKRNKCKDIFTIIKSNLFENVTGTFDFIFGNLPVSNESWELETSTQDLLKRFLSECPKYLKKEGKVYFTWSSDADIESIKSYLLENKYNVEVKTKKTEKRIWYLFEIRF